MVIWLGSAVPKRAKRVFIDRGYKVRRCTPVDLVDPAFLSGIGAVILTMVETQSTFADLRAEIAAHAPQLLNFDCRVIVKFERTEFNESVLIRMLRRMKIPYSGLPMTTRQVATDEQDQMVDEPPQPNVKFYDTGDSWKDIANFLVENPAGKAPNPNTKVIPEDLISPMEKLLMQRAFENCVEVRLEPLKDGRSKAHVYIAHAKINKLNGRWMQPYFVKMGQRNSIFQEYINYQENVDNFIPFHLGPHLVAERCCLGATDAVIVGDYVEQSESLKNSAREGRAARAIACLFDHTLHGWYRNARPEAHALMARPDVRLPQRYPPNIGAAARAIGATMDVTAHAAQLAAYTDQPWLCGPIHGDLHALNIRTRGTDAIVIDFLGHKTGLVLRDIARLEVSLLTDAFDGAPYENPKDENDFNGPDWLHAVMPLYGHDPTVITPRFDEDPSSPAHWFHACAHQIRRHARDYELRPRQYAAALVLELLWKACRDDVLLPFETYRRGAACYLAEQMLQAVFP